MSDPEPWGAVEGVVRHLGISKNTVYRWIEARSLPAYKIDHLWKFKLSDIYEWMRTGGATDDVSETGGTA